MCNNTPIEIQLGNGILRAEPSLDPDYPGIDIEYIDNDEDSTAESRPRVLVELPLDSNYLRCLCWTDRTEEDYTEEVILDKIDTNCVYAVTCDSTCDGTNSVHTKLFSKLRDARDDLYNQVDFIKRNDHLLQSSTCIIDMDSANEFCAYEDGEYLNDHIKVYIEKLKIN